MMKTVFKVYFFSALAMLLFADMAAADSDGLPTALTLAIQKHPSVTAKLEELKSFGYDINSAEAGRYPSLSMQGQTMSNEQTQVVAKLQQPLWAGGRISGAINLAEIKLRSAQASLLQIRRQLMEDTSAIYAELLGARQRLRTAEMNVKEHEKLLALISRRQVGSFASEADVRLARSRLTQAQAQQEQLYGVVEKAQSDLQALTQEPLAGLSAVENELLQLPDPAVIMKDAETNSPTVQLRIIEVDVARIQADLRESDMMPTLNAVVERDIYVANKYGNVAPDTRVGVAVSGSVEGIGFAGFGRIKSATALVEAARKNVETAKNDLRRRTAGIVSDRKMYERVMESNNLLVTATQETLDSFMRQYDVGRKSWVDVLNAQKELADARQSMEQTKSSLMEMSLRLGVLIGRLDRFAGLLP
jgi:adhesin transport system outer membrane protein